jgi:TRAP-type C4-dicarboxylate transport system permease small subunit
MNGIASGSTSIRDHIASGLISIEKYLTRINMVLAMVCGVVWFLFMLMTIGDVTGRYAFLAPIPGTMEVGSVVLAFSVFMSWAAVLARNQHIRIYIAIDRMSPRLRFWFDILCYVCGFAVVVPIAYYGLSFAVESLRIKEFGITYGIPLYPAKLALFIGASLLSLEFLMQLLLRIFPKSSSAAAIDEEHVDV